MTSYRLGEAIYTRGLQPTEPVTELDRSATSSAGGCPSSRDANEGVPVRDVPRRNGQWGEGGTVRGLGPARESTDISRYRGIEDFMGGGLKQSVPTFDGKIFPRYKQEAIFFAHHYGFESIFTDAGAQRDVNVGDINVSTARLEAEFCRKAVKMHLSAWRFLSSSLKAEVDRDILFREKSPAAVWRALGEMHSPRTQGARLELLAKLDSVHIVPSENPVEKYLKMEEYARALRLSSGDMQHINEPFLPGKFLNALPTEYDV